ncbi:MAG: cell division protein ZipA [Gammaproteobacteria bacterium]|nr:cell division protein ZipA [Gammaproteobacteria bacterium]MBU2478282.1 cell division protein ZipA [Gammaproteobacteria bacterium]
MDLLRWILLIIGALIVVGVYLWSRRGAREQENLFVRTEPGVGNQDDEFDPLFAPASKYKVPPPNLTNDDGEPDLEAMHRELSSLQELLKAEAADKAARAEVAAQPVSKDPVEDAPVPVAEDKVVALYLVAQSQQVFSGADVDAALREVGLQYDDELHIYNRYPNGADSGTSVFGVANLVEPGTLELAAMAETGTPGLTLFLQLPGPLRPLQAFDLFATTAQQLATRLNGELRDKTRSTLSRQTLDHLRDDIQQFERRQRLHHA